MKRLLATMPVATAAMIIGVMAATVATAYAMWTVTSDTGAATHARAGTLPPGPTPTVLLRGGTAHITWTATRLSSGASVAGYLVTRYDNDGRPTALLPGCAGIRHVPNCTDPAVPEGTWRYTVTPLHGAWRGQESAPSVPLVVDRPPSDRRAPTSNPADLVHQRQPETAPLQDPAVPPADPAPTPPAPAPDASDPPTPAEITESPSPTASPAAPTPG